ncbi:MAG: DUF4328 domain-containing protein [Polyangiales bacterium]
MSGVVHGAQLRLAGVAEPSVALIAVAERLDGCAVTLAWIECALLLGTAVAFARWTASAVRVAATFGAAPVRWSPRAAAWAWLIPGVNLVRPPRVIGALVASIGAKSAGAIAPRPLRDAAVGYREPAMARASRLSQSLPITAWWTLWLGSRVTEAAAALWPAADVGAFMVRARLDVFSDVLLIAATATAFVVVRGVDAALSALGREAREDA